MTLYNVSAGQTDYAAILNNTDDEEVNAGGTASGTVVNSGGVLNVNSGGIAGGTTVNSGGVENIYTGLDINSILNGGREYVLSGGTADNTVINSGAALGVDTGGIASGAVVNHGGLEYINSGGITSGTTVNSNGYEYLYSGGVASGSVLNTSGEEGVASGGVAISTVINSGGYAYVFSGGVASNTVIHSGGLMGIADGGYASGIEDSRGGILFIDGASASVSGLVLDNDSFLEFRYASVTSVTVNSSSQLLVRSAGGVIEKLGLAANFSYSFTERADGTGGTMILVTSNQPVLSSISYNAGNGQLTLTGSNLTPHAQGFTPADFTLTGDGGISYTLSSASSIKGTPASSSAVIQLSAADQLAMNGLLNKNGTTANDGSTAYSLSATSGWDSGASAISGQSLSVNTVAAPAIHSVAYNVASGVFTVSGVNLDNHGSANGIALTEFKLNGGANNSYSFSASNDAISNLKSTSYTITLSSAGKVAVNAFTNANGLATASGAAYNLTATANWDSDSGTTIKTQAVTVIGAPPIITGAAYNAANGQLTLSGHNFTTRATAYSVTDFSLTGDGGNVYTLSKSSTISGTPGSTKVVINLSAADQLAVDGLLNSNGGKAHDGVSSYGLSVQSGWDTGAAAIADTGLTVSNVTAPTLSAVAYNAATGVFTISGAHLDNQATTSGINLNDFTLNGGVNGSYLFNAASDTVSHLSASGFTLTLGSTDKTAVNTIVTNNGGSPLSGASYALVVSANWDSDSGNAINKLAVTASALDVFATQPKSKPVMISELLEGDGQIELSKAIYTAFAGESAVQATNFSNATAATSAMDYLYYNAHTGGLYYDAGGAGSSKSPMEIAVIGVNSHPAALSVGDFKLVA
jgi:autotransporter passenger strand-loop-strand repeat protein